MMKAVLYPSGYPQEQGNEPQSSAPSPKDAPRTPEDTQKQNKNKVSREPSLPSTVPPERGTPGGTVGWLIAEPPGSQIGAEKEPSGPPLEITGPLVAPFGHTVALRRRLFVPLAVPCGSRMGLRVRTM